MFRLEAIQHFQIEIATVLVAIGEHNDQILQQRVRHRAFQLVQKIFQFGCFSCMRPVDDEHDCRYEVQFRWFVQYCFDVLVVLAAFARVSQAWRVDDFHVHAKVLRVDKLICRRLACLADCLVVYVRLIVFANTIGDSRELLVRYDDTDIGVLLLVADITAKEIICQIVDKCWLAFLNRNKEELIFSGCMCGVLEEWIKVHTWTGFAQQHETYFILSHFDVTCLFRFYF